MRKVTVDEVESWMSPASVKRSLGKALGAEGLSMNLFELQPGESFAFGYHKHEGQEEVFYVLEGTATFETEEGEVQVSADEAIRFEPGEWQQGRNAGSEPVRALAVGAPAEMGETTILRECPECEETTAQDVEMADSKDALVTVCVDCGAETGRFD
ncbi:cupin domain-containing protein [Natronomonas sp. EA1]|uniref:cupin domain-containing protein n=1 Tax=Natronomonas sp. EA1 TaxID=3421655 RepID=UPI003EB82245